jgi:hypothetical protein
MGDEHCESLGFYSLFDESCESLSEDLEESFVEECLVSWSGRLRALCRVLI